MSTDTIAKSDEGQPPTMAASFVARIKHPATRKGTAIGALAGIFVAFAAAVIVDYNGYRRGVRDASSNRDEDYDL